MQGPRRRDVLALGAAALCAPPAFAETRKYPDRPIKLVVPFVPGGVNDIVARLWGDRVKQSLGAVFIENQGGAGGAVGANAVAHAQGDGYTILLGGGGSLVLSPIAMSKPLYDPIKDFEPIAILALSALAIAVTPDLPVHTVSELVAYDKAHPGSLLYGSAGTGTMTHLGAELFKSLAGLHDIVHVPYKGSGASITDVISGQLPMIIANVTGQVLELNRSGKLRLIAVLSPERLVADPSIPTAVESGLQGAIAANFTGLFAPAKTPLSIVEQVAAATRDAMDSEDVRRNLIDQGLEPVRASTPEKTQRFLAEDIARWTPIARAIGLKFN